MANYFYRLPTDLVDALDNVSDPDTARAQVIATAIGRAHEDIGLLGPALVHRAMTAPWKGPTKVFSVSMTDAVHDQLETMAKALDVTDILVLRLCMENEVRLRTCCRK
ncbi:MAG: hypothetical protein RL375_3184 [Pseudomonadota bacterium]|jgi:predicted transcriptional regulator